MAKYTKENGINSTESNVTEQIQSFFTVQKIVLNKVGVLMGLDFEVDRDGKSTTNLEKFHNTKGNFTVEEMKDPRNQIEFALLDFGIMMNSENIWNEL